MERSGSAPRKRRCLRRVGAGKRGARLSLTTPEFRDILIELETRGGVERAKTACVNPEKARSAMTDDLRRQPRRAGRIALLKLALVAAIAGAALVSACSQPSDSQQPGAQQQPQAADGQTRTYRRRANASSR